VVPTTKVEVVRSDIEKFNRWLFEVMNTVTLVAERRTASWASSTQR